MIRIANPEPTCIFAFTGRVLDKDVGLQSTPNRHFDPAVGRWLDDVSSGDTLLNSRTSPRTNEVAITLSII